VRSTRRPRADFARCLRMVCAQTASQTARRPRAALRRRQRPLGQKAAAFCEVCAQTTSQTSHGLRLPTGLTTFADSLPSPCLTACAALSGDKEVDLENSSERFGTGSSARADVEGDAASHIRRSSILSRRTVVVRVGRSQVTVNAVHLLETSSAKLSAGSQGGRY
jgi:hypothetical protein